MGQNNISTHLPKNERKDLKMGLAETERKTVGATFRELNEYVTPGLKSPYPGRPWQTILKVPGPGNVSLTNTIRVTGKTPTLLIQ